MRIMKALCVAALVAATPALAETPPSPKDKQICKRSRVTGSLAQTTKVCGTRAFWEERKRQSKDWTKELTDKKQPPAWGGGGA